ncbi:hypothetical protein [Chitinophaga arvensicola]|uniref:hypothetical protein n=1 Tax=Chitinophaga arvensicola TaxID=29529 RepID=UPI00115FC800|nr:hypothetical protein [Chitinophaga arvensicola]
MLSCKEEKDLPTVNALLRKHHWKLQSWTSSPAFPYDFTNETRYFTDIFELYTSINQNCYTDQEMIFGNSEADTSHSYQYYIGRNFCGKTQAADKGFWMLEDQNKIYLYMMNAPYTLDSVNQINQLMLVEELTEDRLIVTQKAAAAGSASTYSWKKVFVPADK